MAQLSKALHLSARGVTTDPGSIPGCITTGCDWESHRAVHNWPSVIRVWTGFGQGLDRGTLLGSWLLWWAGYMQADIGHQLNDVWQGSLVVRELD